MLVIPGQMAERFKAPVLKTGIGTPYHEFESRSALVQIKGCRYTFYIIVKTQTY